MIVSAVVVFVVLGLWLFNGVQGLHATRIANLPCKARCGKLFAVPLGLDPLHSHLRHEPQFRQGISELKRLMAGRLKLATGGVTLQQQVMEIVDHPSDVTIVLALYLSYKPVLKLMYSIQEWIRLKFSKSLKEEHTYNYSFFGY